MTVKLLLIISVLLVSASRSQSPPHHASYLNGDYVADQIGSTSINKPFTINIKFPNIRVGGCNSLSSTITFDRSINKIRFQPFSSTRKSCPIDQDGLITAALENTRSVSADGQYLVFNDESGAQLFRAKHSESQPIQTRPLNVVMINLNGDYSFNRIGSMVFGKSIKVNIDNPNIRVAGCNSLSSTYAFDASTNKIRFQKFSSTRMSCPGDQDNLIKFAFENARSVSVDGQFLVFKDQRGAQIFRAKRSESQPQAAVPTIGGNQPVTVLPINGDYVVDQVGSTSINKPFSINIADPNIRVGGCNSMGSTFTYGSSTQKIQFQPFSSTRKSCPINQDGLITAALESTRSVSADGQYLVFNDESGAQLFRARRTESQSSVPIQTRPLNVVMINLNGDYGIDQIGDLFFRSPLKVNIDNPNIRVAGCNSLTSTYAFDSSTNSLRFQPFSSTRKFCQGDQDGLIKAAFEKVRSVSVDGQYLVFNNQNGAQLFRTKRSESQPQSSVPIQTRPLQVVMINLNGNFVVDKVGSTSINKPFSINIDNPNIRIGGCNSLSSTYSFDASTNKIQFQGFSSTRKSCPINQDGLITAALENTRSVSLDGQYLVFNDQNGVQLVRARRTESQSQSPVVP